MRLRARIAVCTAIAIVAVSSSHAVEIVEFRSGRYLPVQSVRFEGDTIRLVLVGGEMATPLNSVESIERAGRIVWQRRPALSSGRAVPDPASPSQLPPVLVGSHRDSAIRPQRSIAPRPNLRATVSARIDFPLSDDGQIYVLEASPNPDPGRGSQIADADLAPTIVNLGQR